MKSHYTQQELDKIMKAIPNRKGWDFSFMKTEIEQVPWEYSSIVKKYLRKNSHVIDVGTGGGERLSSFSPLFGSGVGTDIDEEMIKIANDNKPDNIKFLVDDEHMKNVNDNFDISLNRHAPFDLKAVAAHLKEGGYFITQQVGEHNMQNIIDALGERSIKPVISKEMFKGTGLRVIAFMEYNLNYVVKDIESLLFWLNALDMLHADFDSRIAAKDVGLLNKVLANGVTPKGYITNEHRYLVIARRDG